MEIEKLDKVIELLKSENAPEAKMFFAAIEPEESSAYFLVKGKVEQKFQNWGEAINAFSKVLEIEPENSEAKNNLDLINSILSFWNPDMFNP